MFNRPVGLCSGKNAIFIADTGNALIRRIDRVTHEVTTITGVLGQRIYKDGPKGTASFMFRGNKPGACAVIGDSLFMLDGKPFSDLKVRKVNLNTGYVTTLNKPDFLGSSSPDQLDVWNNTLFFLHRLKQGTVVVTSAETEINKGRTQNETAAYPIDINEDGVLDLLLSTKPTVKQIKYRRGDGKGNYQYISTTKFPEHPHSFETLNIGGDTKPDMLVGLTNSIGSYINLNGQFAEDRNRTIFTRENQFMRLIDANKDGKVDIAWIDIRGDLRVVLANDAGSWIANGPGKQGEHFRMSSGVGSPRWFHLVDVDNDADLDLLVLPTYGQEVAYFEGISPTP